MLRDIIDPANKFIADLARDSPMTMVVVGEDHLIVAIEGNTLLDALGYAWPSDVIGHPVEIFLPDDKKASHQGWFNAWLSKPETRRLRDAQPMVVAKKDGGTATVRISIKKLYLPDGRDLGERYAGAPFRGGLAYVFVDF